MRSRQEDDRTAIGATAAGQFPRHYPSRLKLNIVIGRPADGNDRDVEFSDAKKYISQWANQ